MCIRDSCEGAGEMFRVSTLDLDNIPRTEDGKINYKEDFFGKETNLTVSGQLNAECYALAFRTVYTFGPTFRAEKSNTSRHAAEFWMVEPEIAFADLQDDMELAEAMLKYVIKYVMDECPEEMAFFNQFIEKGLLDKLNHIVSSDFGKVTYTEAVEMLKNCGKTFEYPVEWGIDLQTEHERYLTEEIFKRPVFVTDYPKAVSYTHLDVYKRQALASICTSLILNIPHEYIVEGLFDCKGAHKRFEHKGEFNGATIIDDYAHHPVEIAATLSTAKIIPHKKIYCVFQPHTYTRTKTLVEEFTNRFKDSDELILMDIYACLLYTSRCV